MADFVAVIRRAVDGLSDNNAEMRQKVYEKARGAVRRQLESMNPRPSDDLVKRQLDKLEAAIDAVEGDHAEALPPEDIAPEPLVEDHALPVPVAEEPTDVEEPKEAEASGETEHGEEPAEEPVAAAPQEHFEDVPAEPALEEEPVEEALPLEARPAEIDVEPEQPETVAEEVSEAEVPPVSAEAHSEPSWHAEAAPADDYVPSWQEPEHPVDGDTEEDVAAPAEPEAQLYAVHDDRAPEAEPVADARMPAAEAQWNWNEAASTDLAPQERDEPAQAAEPLAWEWPDEKAAEQPAPEPEKAAQPGDWNDLDTLLGHTPKADSAAGMAQAGLSDAAASTPPVETARGPQRSFRAEPRKSRFGLGALAALIGLVVVVGGAGAAYWFNRDSVDGWVNEKIASFTAPSVETPSAQTSQTDNATDGDSQTPASETPAGTADNASGASSNTEVAVATPSSNGKFTQRLLTDGTEVDEGPAAAIEGTTPEEGRSVAAQTPEATDNGDASAGAQAPAGAETTTTPEGGTPAASGEQPAAIGVTQKMFLYEERLGQTAPTAIEGTVAWSSAEESPGGDAKPEPVVRAQVNVPSKGLTALITFRRNADKSLPASHIVELVFSLPENFEGGGIESVQRVAMKRTEQDRGDALIAVPAKITDDFHMIALNDFPEAIAKNTELLRTRSWIDIPITYRNGRRALLTLDKGTAGTEAFDKVMKAWATLGAAGGQ